MTEDAIELAWAAGVFEGEGSVRINSITERNWGALLVDMVNVDKQMVELFQRRWPGYFRFIPPKGNARGFWRYRSAAHTAAKCLTDLLPYFRTDRIREKALLGLAFQEQKSLARDMRRNPAYKLAQQDFYLRMAALNSRGFKGGNGVLHNARVEAAQADSWHATKRGH